jgi:hypothetical protein
LVEEELIGGETMGRTYGAVNRPAVERVLKLLPELDIKELELVLRNIEILLEAKKPQKENTWKVKK